MEIDISNFGAGIAVVLAIVTSPAAAQDAGEADKSAASVQASHGPLDGMSFVGKIGPEDNRDLDDELHFAAGQFWSANCVACGYQPGHYWSRTVGESIHFRGSLQSADDGRFDYSGHVVGVQIDVRINWIQQRWYGDIERKLAFVGSLAPAAPPSRDLDLPAAPNSDATTQCRRL